MKNFKIRIYELKFCKLQQFQYFAMIFHKSDQWWCFCFGCNGRSIFHGSSCLLVYENAPECKLT